MSPKTKMSDIHDECDDDIIELSDEELKEILADDDFDDSEEYGEIRAVNKAKGERGERLTTNIPYGYKANPDNPMENRRIFYNTHPAIISLEVFDKVQEIRQQRHRRTEMGKSNMFSGDVLTKAEQA